MAISNTETEVQELDQGLRAVPRASLLRLEDPGLPAGTAGNPSRYQSPGAPQTGKLVDSQNYLATPLSHSGKIEKI